jgi:hypothetical protein
MISFFPAHRLPDIIFLKKIFALCSALHRPLVRKAYVGPTGYVLQTSPKQDKKEQTGAERGNMSVLEKLKALDEERFALLEAAKAEAFEIANKAIAALGDLGLHYQLIETNPNLATSRSRPRAERKRSDGPCPVCGFKTEPSHDGRAHRSQKTKRPFSVTELSERGMKRAE